MASRFLTRIPIADIPVLNESGPRLHHFLANLHIVIAVIVAVSQWDAEHEGHFIVVRHARPSTQEVAFAPMVEQVHVHGHIVIIQLVGQLVLGTDEHVVAVHLHNVLGPTVVVVRHAVQFAHRLDEGTLDAHRVGHLIEEGTSLLVVLELWFLVSRKVFLIGGEHHQRAFILIETYNGMGKKNQFIKFEHHSIGFVTKQHFFLVEHVALSYIFEKGFDVPARNGGEEGK